MPAQAEDNAAAHRQPRPSALSRPIPRTDRGANIEHQNTPRRTPRGFPAASLSSLGWGGGIYFGVVGHSHDGVSR
jgi:hypothetical protein